MLLRRSRFRVRKMTNQSEGLWKTHVKQNNRTIWVINLPVVVVPAGEFPRQRKH